MNTVVLEVRTLSDVLTGAARTLDTGRPEAEAHIAFASPELLWQVLTGKRWELLQTMCGAGPMSIREAARRVGRCSRPAWSIARKMGASNSPLTPSASSSSCTPRRSRALPRR